MRKLTFVTILLASALLFSATAAQADTLTVNFNGVHTSGCTSCFGANFTVTITPTATPNQYTVTLEIDASSVSPAFLAQITSVNVKISSSIAALELLSAPGGATNWSSTMGPISNAGCMGVNAGFACAQANSNGLAPTGGTLTWTWLITLPPGTPINLEIHIGAKFNNSDGTRNGFITSEEVVIPEPGTMALFSTGLAVMAGWRRRQQRKNKAQQAQPLS